MDAYDIIKID